MPMNRQQLLEMFGNAADEQQPAPQATQVPEVVEPQEPTIAATPDEATAQTPPESGPVSKAQLLSMFGGDAIEEEQEIPEEKQGFLTNLLRQVKGGFFDFISREGTANALDDAERVQARRDGREYGGDISPNQFGGISQAVKTSRANVDPAFKEQYVAEAETQLRDRVAGAIANRKKGEAIPMSPETLEFLNENSELSIWEGFKAAPATIIGDLGARSLTAMAPGLALGAAGGAVAGPGGFAAGMGAGSARVEYASSFMEHLRNQGVDIDDPDAIIGAINDKELMEGANEYATRRAAVIGGVDTLAGLVGAKYLVPGVGNTIAKELLNVPAQMAVQAGLGAAGETGAQLANLEELNPRQIAAEAAGELVTAPIDVAVAGISGARRAAQSTQTTEGPSLAEEIDSVDTAFERAAASAREQGGDALDQTLAGALSATEVAAKEADSQPIVADADALQQVRDSAGIKTLNDVKQQDIDAQVARLKEESARNNVSPEAQQRAALQNVREQLGIRTIQQEQADAQAKAEAADAVLVQDADAVNRVRSQLGITPASEQPQQAPTPAADIAQPQQAPTPAADTAQSQQATTPAADIAQPQQASLQSVRSQLDITPMAEVQKEQDANNLQRARTQWREQVVRVAESAQIANEVTQTPVNPVMAQAFAKASAPKNGLSVRREAAIIAKQAQEAATSPTNAMPEPTEAQKAAGNYKKGHIKVSGLDVTIENPAGSTRRGVDPGGKPWAMDMQHHYGYIKRTKGADGENVDVFVGNNPQSDKVFVVDQVDQTTGEFDEHKVMLGFNNPVAAARGYRKNYEKGFKVGPIKEMTRDEFGDWLRQADNTKPVQPEKIKYDAGPAIPISEFQAVVDARKRRRPDEKVRFRQGNEILPKSGPAKLKAVEQVTAELVQELKGADINVIENVNQLPASTRKLVQGASNPKGAYDPNTDKVYIFSDGHSDTNDAVRTVLHEAVAHKGTRVVLSDSFGPTMDSVYREVKNVEAFAKVTEGLETATKEGQRIAAEEYIAHIAESKDNSSVLDKVIAAVRKALRRIGVVNSWSDNDIREMLRQARKALRKPKSGEGSLASVAEKVRLREDELAPEARENPLHPTAQRFRIAMAAEAQANYKPRLKERVGDFAKDVAEAQIPKLLSLISRRNLVDYAGDRLPALREYVREAARMDGTRNGLLIDFEKVLDPWNRFNIKNKARSRNLSELMHESTLAEIDPSGEYSPLVEPRNMSQLDKEIDRARRQKYAILKRRFDRLPTEAQNIYTSVRDAYAKQRDAVFSTLIDNIEKSEAEGPAKKSLIAELRTKFETGRTKGPYFPLARFGDYWAVARDADGEVISYSRFESPSERKAWIKSFTDLGNGVTATGGGKMDEKSMLSRIDPKFVVNVTKLTQALPPELAGPVTDEVWQLYLRSMPEMSMRKSFIHRKGRLGFSEDALRAFGHHMFHGAHQLAKLRHLPVMEKQMDNLREQALKSEELGGKEAKWAAPLYREMVMRHDFAKNPQASPIATMATSFGFAWYLGATPAAAITNLSQNAVVAFPHLAAKYGAGAAAKELSKAYKEYFGTKGPMSKKLSGDELAAFNEAYRIGLFEHTQAHDLAGVAEEGMRYNSTMRTVMAGVSWMFHKAEESNRQTSFMASYRLNRKKGLSHADAVLAAEDDTKDSHFDYTNANRPRIMQSNSAKVILLFKQYSANMIYRLSRDLHDASKGTFKQVGKRLGLSDADIAEHEQVARSRLAGIMVMTSLLGGLSSMPLKSMVTGIIDSVMGDEDEPFDSDAAFRAYLTATVGEKAQEFIYKGAVDAGVGATLSSRVSLNNLLWRTPEPHLEGDELFMHYLGEAVGPVFAVPKDYFKAAQSIKGGHVERGVEAMLPKAGRDVLKALRYYDEGALNFRKQEIMAPEQFSAVDIALQASGFTPAKLTQQYEQNRAVKNAESKIKRRRTLLMDTLFLAQRTEDREAYDDTMAKIKKFNKANPSVAISASSVVQSARSRGKFDARALGGVAVDPKLSYLHNKYRFAPRPGDKDGKKGEKE